jgi:hypothetical protein
MKSAIMGLILAFLLAIGSGKAARAHEGQPPAPHDLWSAWSWDPVILVSWLSEHGCMRLGCIALIGDYFYIKFQPSIKSFFILSDSFSSGET